MTRQVNKFGINKMTTLKYFQNEVFIINHNGEIESMSYEEYLNDFHSDEMTSPRGLENRIQLASVLIGEDEEVITYSLNDRDGLIAGEGEELKWALYNWGIGGNHGHLEQGELFDTEDDAYTEILKGKEYDYQNGNYNSPTPYDSYDAAEAARIEMLADSNSVDIDVMKSIESKAVRVLARRKEHGYSSSGINLAVQSDGIVYKNHYWK